MRQFEITLPLSRNDGTDYHDAHDRFELHLLNTVGGFTRSAPQQGLWRDDKTGIVYSDDVVTYRVALQNASSWPDIVSEAGRIFDDQLAIFHADLGDAWIDTNAHHQPAAIAA